MELCSPLDWKSYMKKNTNEQSRYEFKPRPSFAQAMLFLLLAAVLILADQVSKFYVLKDQLMMSGGAHEVITEFFYLRYAFNTGAAWSMLADPEWGIYLLSGISIVASLVFIVMLIRYSNWPKLLPFSISMALAGTVGNLIDRIRLGGVIDFLDFKFGEWHFPTFNLADSLIVVGMILILIYVLFFEEKHKEKFQSDQRFQVRKL